MSHPLGVVPSALVACFGNLVLVGAIAPWLSERIWAHRSLAAAHVSQPATAPLEVIRDRAATGLLVAGTAGVLAAGLAARPLVISETTDSTLNANVVKQYVLANAAPEFKNNLDTANTLQLGSNYYRTCIASNDRLRAYCLLVNTKPRPPAVTVDPSTTPNPASSDSGGL